MSVVQNRNRFEQTAPHEIRHPVAEFNRYVIKLIKAGSLLRRVSSKTRSKGFRKKVN